MEKAYIAGFFDGEGSVSICRHSKYKNRLVTIAAISQVDARPLKVLHELYGGSLMLLKNKPTRPGGAVQPIWRWQISNKQIEPFFNDIMPYLIVKKSEAELAMMARALARSKTGKRSHTLTDQEVSWRNDLMGRYTLLRGGAA